MNKKIITLLGMMGVLGTASSASALNFSVVGGDTGHDDAVGAGCSINPLNRTPAVTCNSAQGGLFNWQVPLTVIPTSGTPLTLTAIGRAWAPSSAPFSTFQRVEGRLLAWQNETLVCATSVRIWNPASAPTELGLGQCVFNATLGHAEAEFSLGSNNSTINVNVQPRLIDVKYNY